MMLELVSDLMLWAAFISTTALLAIYGLLQPWWRSWFGIAMILTITALWQIDLRALVTLWLGEGYAGRDWALLVGRSEIAVAMTIASIGLGRDLLRAWRRPGLPETHRQRTQGDSRDSGTTRRH